MCSDCATAASEMIGRTRGALQARSTALESFASTDGYSKKNARIVDDRRDSLEYEIKVVASHFSNIFLYSEFYKHEYVIIAMRY